MKNNIIILSAIFLSNFAFSQVGIGISNPDPSSILHLESSNKGFLPPKVVLHSETDNVAVLNPANGLLVYNTSANLSGPGLYYNDGTSSSPIWSKFQAQNSSTGLTTGKVKYSGKPNITKIVSVGNLQFRINMIGTVRSLEMRMLTPPTAPVLYYTDRISWFGGTTTVISGNVSFTTSDWLTWKQYSSAGGNLSPNATIPFLIYVSSLDDNSFYQVNIHARYGNNADEFWNESIIAY